MRDDEIPGLLRTLEDEREPDPTFADALYERLAVEAQGRSRRSMPVLLLAAAILLGTLGVGAALGTGLLRLPLVLDASTVPSASTGPSASPQPSATPPPLATPGPGLAFEVPAGILPPGAIVVAAAELDLREWPSAGAPVSATVPAGERMSVSGPLMVDGERWYRLISLDDPEEGGQVALDPGAGTVRLEPVACPTDAPSLAVVARLTEWERLACYGDRELVLDGHEIVGFGGFRYGTYEPEWLNGFLGEFAVTSGEGNGLFVRVEPGTVDTARPPVEGEIGSALLRLTGHFNDDAAASCTATEIPITADPEGPTADFEPIAAQLTCREQFVVTGFEVMDGSADASRLIGRTVVAAANGIGLRSTASADGTLVRRLNAGQAMSIVSGPVAADDMRWYEVRIGPGTTTGWVTTGPNGDWLRLVDDGLIAFRCEGCGSDRIVTITLDGDLVAGLGGTEAYSSFAWSPDGSRIAQTVDDGGATPGWTSVLVMEADGSNARTLGGSNGPVAWSPDGTRLAWAFNNDVVVTDEELVGRPLGLDAAGVRQPTTPSWSPDGTRLAFTALDCPTCTVPVAGDYGRTLFTVRVDGSGLRTLLEPDSGTLDGGWAPDGSRLMLTRGYLDGEWAPHAFTIGADGGEPEFLPDGLASPVWSPDGTRMAWSGSDGLFVSGGGDPADARLLDPAGMGEVHWAPSGNQLLYGVVSEDGTTQHLWVVPADGSAPPSRVTPDGVSATTAAWQPVLLPLP